MVEEFPVPLQTPSLSYLDLEPSVANYYEDDSFGGSGGVSNYDFMVDPNDIMRLTDSGSMILSNGYVFADYDRDKHFDQVWRGDGKGGWETCVGGGLRWVRDDGPIDEMEELDRTDP